MNPLLLRDTIGMAQGGAPTQVGSGMGGLGAMLGMLLPQLGAALLGTPGAQQVANLVSKMAQDQLVQQYINRKMIDPNAPAPFGITPEQRLMAEGLVHTRRMEALEQQGMELQKTQSKRQGEQFDWQKQMANEQMLREGLRQDEEARRFNEEMGFRKEELASNTELRKSQQEITKALYGARRTPAEEGALETLRNPNAEEWEIDDARRILGMAARPVTPPPPVGGAGGTTGSAGPAAGGGTGLSDYLKTIFPTRGYGGATSEPIDWAGIAERVGNSTVVPAVNSVFNIGGWGDSVQGFLDRSVPQLMSASPMLGSNVKTPADIMATPKRTPTGSLMSALGLPLPSAPTSGTSGRYIPGTGFINQNMPTISVSHKVDKGDGAATNFKMDVPYDMWASMDKDLLKRLGFGPMPWESVKW